jgi:hypothetical protein
MGIHEGSFASRAYEMHESNVINTSDNRLLSARANSSLPLNGAPTIYNTDTDTDARTHEYMSDKPRQERLS